MKNTVIKELTESIHSLSLYELNNSLKWVNELLLDIADGDEQIEIAQPTINHRICTAKSYFRDGEFLRCSNVLSEFKDVTSNHVALFLYGYSLYLSGEKQKANEQIERDDESSSVVNVSVERLLLTFKHLYNQGMLDCFGKYLLAIFYRECHEADKAKEILCESLNEFPCNWSAWLDLANLCECEEDIEKLSLKDHWMKKLFVIYSCSHIQRHDIAFDQYTELPEFLQKTTFVKSLKAVIHYFLHQYTECCEEFEQIRIKDPYRLDGLGAYSDVLFIREEKAKLSTLAHEVVKVEKFSPETCLILGNYYAIKTKHEKAIFYFKRALRLNPKNLLPWILLGHEFVELHKTAEAIQCYHKGAITNDYRAWYNLGLQYEMLQMFQFAIYYYKKACFVKPYDSVLWNGLAACYEKTGHDTEAIKCYEKAEGNRDADNKSTIRLAILYQKTGNNDKAAKYYKLYVDRCEDDSINNNQELLDAIMFLVKYYQEVQDFKNAEYYCQKLLCTDGPEKEEAGEILKEIQVSSQITGGDSLNATASSFDESTFTL